MHRPNVPIMNSLCFAQFAASYTKGTYCENDYQRSQIDGYIPVSTEDYISHLPKRITLDTLPEVMIRRETKLVLRYYKPNKNLYPEQYAHHMLMLFFPFKKEEELLSDSRYSTKLADPSVLAIVNKNKHIFEPNSDIIDACWLQLQNNENRERLMFSCVDSSKTDEEDDTVITDTEIDNSRQNTPAIPQYSQLSMFSQIVTNKDISKMICSLYTKQR